VLAALCAHPKSQALCARAGQVVLAAAVQQRPEVLSGPQVIELGEQPLEPIARAEAQTEFGNLVEVLDEGATSPTHWLLLDAAVALHVARSWPLGGAATLVSQLVWLAGATPCNPWTLLDDCLESASAEQLWQEATAQVPAASATVQLGIALAVVGATSPAAVAFKDALCRASAVPAVRQVLENGQITGALSGEVGRRRPAAWSTALGAVTGWLLLRGLARLTARYLLGARRVGELRVERQCVTLIQRRRLLGREFSERRTTLPLQSLTQLTRETRFVGMGIYFGLLSLCVGTLVGMGLVVDSVRVAGGSPSLLTSGLLIILAGLVLDFVLSSLARYRTGKTSVLIVPQRGRPLVLDRVPSADADAWLRKLSALSALTR